ncbi:hypothetical protein Fot_06282 [Forsythia ovata]|uniref:Helicase ATP-binding domain-containing protein n=1 Tax=Forsythia ovata TaxID=205694 RepID=A0ABD1WVJ3_9LAMI
MRRDVQEIFKMTPHDKQVMMFSATLSKEIRPVRKQFMQDGRSGCDSSVAPESGKTILNLHLTLDFISTGVLVFKEPFSFIDDSIYFLCITYFTYFLTAKFLSNYSIFSILLSIGLRLELRIQREGLNSSSKCCFDRWTYKYKKSCAINAGENCMQNSEDDFVISSGTTGWTEKVIVSEKFSPRIAQKSPTKYQNLILILRGHANSEMIDDIVSEK